MPIVPGAVLPIGCARVGAGSLAQQHVPALLCQVRKFRVGTQVLCLAPPPAGGLQAGVDAAGAAIFGLPRGVEIDYVVLAHAPPGAAGVGERWIGREIFHDVAPNQGCGWQGGTGR